MHAGPDCGQDERAHDAQDVGPVHHLQGARPAQAACAWCQRPAGDEGAAGRDCVRHCQDLGHRAQQGALCQASSAYRRSWRKHAQGHRASHRLLRARAGQHGVVHGILQGSEGGAPHHHRLHAQHPPDLPHQGAHDPPRARQGPEAGQRVLGPFPPQYVYTASFFGWCQANLSQSSRRST